ncbi:MAG: hypothetical protein ACI9AT_000654 [Ulvibacter sp.]|jgi:hypothetical protein
MFRKEVPIIINQSDEGLPIIFRFVYGVSLEIVWEFLLEILQDFVLNQFRYLNRTLISGHH